jgi:hypothetical protein
MATSSDERFTIGPAHRTEPHLLADLAELILALEYDRRTRISKADLQAYVDVAETPAEELDETEAEDGDPVVSSARIARQIDDAWRTLSYRDKAFGRAYPFDVSRDQLTINAELTSYQRVYRLLLMCSRLRSFAKTKRGKAASAFTELAARAMKGLVAPDAEVRIFDANSVDRRKYYGTNLREALKKLGNDLHEGTRMHEECEKQSTSGDLGIDLVAVYPFKDGAATTHAILGQCAARETEWPDKRLEAGPASTKVFTHLLVDAATALFIPVSFRDSSGAWVTSKRVTECILIDRARIISLLQSVEGDGSNLVRKKWFTSCEKLLTT